MIRKEDFPALPVKEKAKPIDTKAQPPPQQQGTAAIPSPLSPPLGKWDEEVAAMDAKMSGKS